MAGADGRSRRVTSTDVAREAGLSRSTVSYVLNDDPRQTIPEATRQRVHAAAAKLGYAPSAAARMLRSGRSELVLCLLPDWPLGPTLGSLLEHLAASLEAHGLTLVLHPRVRTTKPMTALWRSISPAAVLVFEDLVEAEQAAIRSAGAILVPNLMTVGPENSGRGPFVEERLGRMQVEHLAATGHRHLGYAFPADDRVRAFAEPRLAGAKMACADLELDLPDIRTVELDPADGEAAVRAWMAMEPRVTAVCAYNDELAMALLAGAGRAGVRVPDDLAVIGVDDIPSAPLTQPPLTTITRDMEMYAEVVADDVSRALTGQPPSGRWPHSGSVSVVRRESA